MKYVYLDHNIYIYALTDNSISPVVNSLKTHQTRFVYSPAHIEEIYKALKDGGKSYRKNAKLLLQMIEDFTDCNELLPTKSEGVVQRVEHPSQCYRRVAEWDTTERMKHDSQDKYYSDSAHYHEMLAVDKHNQSISTLSYEAVWKHPAIASALADLNDNLHYSVERANASTDTMLCAMMGVDKRLPLDLQIEKGSFDKLKGYHTQLEYIIEVLFRLLNRYGYNSEKNQATTLSGIHDVTHAIYAAYTEIIITTDFRFAQKCKAVYYFLGVPTRVICCGQNEIASTLKSLKDDHAV
ncbi:MAG: hypothetical protein E7425_04245 [Ruminococcaceae bacterium]|nr:hypothetical protein [Oscillospiraceae bacterium]